MEFDREVLFGLCVAWFICRCVYHSQELPDDLFYYLTAPWREAVGALPMIDRPPDEAKQPTREP